MLSPGLSSEEFRAQWTAPADVFSVLLIVGGDIVARALAQLCGSRITPVAFSFGWVAYAVSAILSAFGEGKMMPVADCACKVIHGKSGFVRDNNSWIIGRIVRDFDYWAPRMKGGDDIKKRLHQVIDTSWKDSKTKDPHTTKPLKAGLCISIFAAQDACPGYAGYDRLYWAGLAAALIQLGIASVPCGIHGDWSIWMVTASGILLSLATGSLSQWEREKWACRRNSQSPFILTKGNGSQHAIVILSEGRGLNLEDLASGSFDLDTPVTPFTRIAILVIGILWIFLLITSAGIRSHTWFLLAVGGVGIWDNLYVAGHARTPDAYGIPLEFVEVIAEPKVMDALFAVESAYPGVGRSMRDTYFPNTLREDEYKKWSEYVNASQVQENTGSIPT